MTSAAIKRRLISYLADAQDNKVKAVYTILEDEINKSDSFNLSDNHIVILDTRRADHLSGKDKSSSRQEVHARIKKKKSLNNQCHTDYCLNLEPKKISTMH